MPSELSYEKKQNKFSSTNSQLLPTLLTEETNFSLLILISISPASFSLALRIYILFFFVILFLIAFLIISWFNTLSTYVFDLI